MDRPGAIPLWSGATATSTAIDGDWRDLLLVNLTGAAVPVAVKLAPATLPVARQT